MRRCQSRVASRAAIAISAALFGMTGCAAAQSPSGAYRPPAYVDTAKFQEVTLALSAAAFTLPAVLTLPRNVDRAPVVVLVHGSGANDRDQSIGPNRPFRDLAWGLASRGIAVLRYDKRTLVAAGRLPTFTVEEEVIADALTALDSVRRHPRVDPRRVFLAGHSLGGMLTPEIVARDRALAGAVVLAGTPRNLADVVIDQLQYLASLPANSGDDAQTNIATARVQLERLIRNEPLPMELVMGVPASYFYDLDAREPLEFARYLDVPVFYLQGGRDYQVTATDLEHWRTGLEASKTSSFKLYPDLNHFFAAGTGKSSPTEYTRPAFVAAEVIDDIARFIEQTRPSKRNR